VDGAARRDDLADKGELQAHLSTCPHCAAEAARHFLLLDLLEGLPAVPAPPGLRERILAHLEAEAGPVFPWRWAAAALLLLGLAAGFVLGRALSPPPADNTPAMVAALGENLNGGPWSAAQRAVSPGGAAPEGRKAP
jgi:anti-sigma factor RsiW